MFLRPSQSRPLGWRPSPLRAHLGITWAPGPARVLSERFWAELRLSVRQLQVRPGSHTRSFQGQGHAFGTWSGLNTLSMWQPSPAPPRGVGASSSDLSGGPVRGQWRGPRSRPTAAGPKCQSACWVRFDEFCVGWSYSSVRIPFVCLSTWSKKPRKNAVSSGPRLGRKRASSGWEEARSAQVPGDEDQEGTETNPRVSGGHRPLQRL